jgi:glycine/D-amino acid oxidase-like deaminating enzyme
MGRHWFGPAVSVETAKPGQPCAVNSVEKAAEQLFAWPDRGPEWRKAVDSCADALTGHLSPAQVRAAFLVAARAAGRLIETCPAVQAVAQNDKLRHASFKVVREKAEVEKIYRRG